MIVIRGWGQISEYGCDKIRGQISEYGWEETGGENSWAETLVSSNAGKNMREVTAANTRVSSIARNYI